MPKTFAGKLSSTVLVAAASASPAPATLSVSRSLRLLKAPVGSISQGLADKRPKGRITSLSCKHQPLWRSGLATTPSCNRTNRGGNAKQRCRVEVAARTAGGAAAHRSARASLNLDVDLDLEVFR